MAKSRTGAFTGVNTQNEAPAQTDVKVKLAMAPQKFGTESYSAAKGLASGVPELAVAQGDMYVFRVEATPRSEMLTITIDVGQLAEQTRVRKINRAIRQAQQ
jgi:hypothetical protein